MFIFKVRSNLGFRVMQGGQNEPTEVKFDIVMLSLLKSDQWLMELRFYFPLDTRYDRRCSS